VGFNAEFDSFAVLCGPNGAGKSSLFDALRLLRNLGTGDALLGGTGEQDVHGLSFRGGMKRPPRNSLNELSADGHLFDYLVHIEQKADFEKPRIISEKARCDGSPLFERDLDGVRVQRADGNQASFPLDWRQAALAAIQPRGSIAKLTLLQAEIAKLFILRPNPRAMEPESKAEARYPDLSMVNLTSWYRSLFNDQAWANALSESLRSVWPDFLSFNLAPVGLNAKALQLRFAHESGESVLLFSGQLSDGERMLIALYMVRAAIETGARGRCLSTSRTTSLACRSFSRGCFQCANCWTGSINLC